MSTSLLPTEVELLFEVIPCNALRTAQEATPSHPCTYFRKWGTYHAYDYKAAGAPGTHEIVNASKYVGRAHVVPEILSGCRKAPILAVGINPNLPGWAVAKHNSVAPLFDDYRQFAHYFRYRGVNKLQIPAANYSGFGGGAVDTPLAGNKLDVPVDTNGDQSIALEPQPQRMYTTYQALLDALATEMDVDWPNAKLTVGEDLAYGNMVACPSARWTTQPIAGDPDLPPMTNAEREGIVGECFHTRRYFLRQLFQSLPAAILVFSQSTANAFAGEMAGHFTLGAPGPSESVEQLVEREIRMRYGTLPGGQVLDARVVFAPHITGTPAEFELVRDKVVAHLVHEAHRPGSRLDFNPATGRLARTQGSCVFCPFLDIGTCDYETELTSIRLTPAVAPASPAAAIGQEKSDQRELLDAFVAGTARRPMAWEATDEAHPRD